MNIGDTIKCYWSDDQLNEDFSFLEIVTFDSDGSPKVQDDEEVYSTIVDEDGNVFIQPNWLNDYN